MRPMTLDRDQLLGVAHAERQRLGRIAPHEQTAGCRQTRDGQQVVTHDGLELPPGAQAIIGRHGISRGNVVGRRG